MGRFHDRFSFSLKRKTIHTKGTKKKYWRLEQDRGERQTWRESSTLRDPWESTANEDALERPSNVLCSKRESIFKRRKAVCSYYFFLFCLSTSSFVLFYIVKYSAISFVPFKFWFVITLPNRSVLDIEFVPVFLFYCLMFL